MSIVGKSEVRVDAFDKATGRTKYYEDRMPAGALYARIKHSEIAHGYVKSIDTSAAEAIEGVVKVLTCFDVPDIAFPTAGHPWSMDPGHQDVADRHLLNRHVRYYGDEVAVVIAENEVAAMQGVRALKVEYDVLPFVLDVQKAMEPDAPQIHEECPGNVLKHTSMVKGNYDEAIANLSKAAEVAELYGNVAALKKANTILAKVYQAQGGTAFNNKDYAAAAEIFAKGYAADPKNTQMALWLGTCYCELKDYDKGMEILEKVAGMQGPKFEADAAEANRLLTLYTNNRVAELQTANDQDGIIAMADKMLEQNPANALAQKIRLQAYLTKKDYAKVIELGEAAAAAQPDETEKSDVYFILGVVCRAEEMKPQAIEALKKVTAGDNVAAAQKSVAELSK